MRAEMVWRVLGSELIVRRAKGWHVSGVVGDAGGGGPESWRVA